MNRARASTSGVEVAAVGRLNERVQVRLSYTYLDANDTTNSMRLVRRPRHLIDAEVRATVLKPWTVGAGTHVVADRVDRGGSMEDYTTVRVFTSYAVRQNLTVKLRVENALNEAYEEVLGYASLPRGVFGSVEWRF